MSNNIYYSKTVLTGGAAGALDSIDGNSLADGDFAYVHASNIHYVYRLDAASGVAESSPDVIAPDTNAGDKRWILQKCYAPDYILKSVVDANTVVGGTSDNTPIALTISQILGFLGSPAEGDMPYYGSGGWELKGVPTYMIVQDQKSQNTAGGTFTAGAWRTRDLNTTEYNNISGASLNSNRITLPAGTYRLRATAPAVGCNMHVTRLQNITAESTILLGTSEYTSADGVCTRSSICGIFTLTASSALEIQHYCSSTGTFGKASNITTEIYTQASIEKIR